MKKIFLPIIILLILSACSPVEEKKTKAPLGSETNPPATIENIATTSSDITIKRGEYTLNYLIDEQNSPDGTKSYKYYSNMVEGCGCYTGDSKCILQLTDAKSKAILKEFETIGSGICVSFREVGGGIPKGWFDGDNLLIEDSGGSMCSGKFYYKTYNIVSGEVKIIWSKETPCILGNKITFNDREYLIEQSDFYSKTKGEQFGNVKIYDMTDIQFTEKDHPFGFGDIYTLICDGDADFTCYQFNPNSKDLTKLTLLKTIPVNGSFEIENDWHGIYFKVDGKRYEIVTEENEIREL